MIPTKKTICQLSMGDAMLGAPTAKQTKVPRTHWDMLLERRSLDDLEEVLAERLAELHAQQPKSRRSA